MACQETWLTRCALVAALVIVLLAKTPEAGTVPKACGGKADILLILDSSASIGRSDYSSQLKFAADVVSEFTIGPNDVRFAAMIFSTNNENIFGFDTYKTSKEVREAILNLKYLNGGTETGAALRSARTYSFTPANGAKPDRAKIAIVITDGHSNNRSDTTTEAYLLKQSGVSVVVVGVGGVDKDEINRIATSPSLTFLVNDYKVLDAIRSQLSQTVCQEQTIQQEQKVNSCIKDLGCAGKADGNYRACVPECQEGYYYNCSNEDMYRMSCALGIYTAPNGTRFKARKVYTQESGTCELESEQCARDPLNYAVIQRDPETVEGGPCFEEQDNCVGKSNGNYPICYPECLDGFYVTCSNGDRYDMPCPLGWYVDKNGTLYLDIMVFDPPTGRCQLTSRSCPRHSREYVRATSPTTNHSDDVSDPDQNPSTGDRPCIAKSDGCLGKQNGDYPKCYPECQAGYFVTCSNGLNKDMPCPLGWYVHKNGTRYLDIMVFDPSTRDCQLTSRSCPRNSREPVRDTSPTENHEPIPDQNPSTGDRPCIAKSGGCLGKQNGDYPKCYPECQAGYFVTCSNGLNNDMPCPLGWYPDSEGNQVLERLIYDPATYACQFHSHYCPREVHKRPNTPPPQTTVDQTTEVIPTCKEMVDLLFCIDSSGSIGDTDYSIQLAFIADLTSYFKVDLNEVLISAILFSSSASIEFTFNDYLDNAGVKKAILELPYKNAETDTAAALALANDEAFSSANGARKNVKEVTIVLTDGISMNTIATSREASRLHSSGVTVIAIGIGNNVRDTELLAIASSPKLVFNTMNFTSLGTIAREVVNNACQTL